jgi:hypothetical protein
LAFALALFGSASFGYKSFVLVLCFCFFFTWCQLVHDCSIGACMCCWFCLEFKKTISL